MRRGLKGAITDVFGFGGLVLMLAPQVAVAYRRDTTRPVLGADLFVMLTDVPAVCAGWGTLQQRSIRKASLPALAKMSFSAGSMGPKVDAACRFATRTGKTAAIGSLAELGRIVAGDAGTTVSTQATGITRE